MVTRYLSQEMPYGIRDRTAGFTPGVGYKLLPPFVVLPAGISSAVKLVASLVPQRLLVLRLALPRFNNRRCASAS